MVMNGNGSYRNEIQEEVLEMESNTNGTSKRLGDFIPIYMPTVDKGLIDHSRREKRFLDFLKAKPSRDWFLKSGFTGRLSPFSFLRRNASRGIEPTPDQEQAAPSAAQQRRRFRVPFVRKINWNSLMKSFKNWLKDPGNIAMFIWLVLVTIGLIVLGLVMLGVLPSGKSRRKNWEEVLNQIVNALFMIMCVYQQPKLFHHLVLVCRWKPADKVELRKVYAKGGAPRPHERAHMMLVIVLLQITFASQYVLCGLFWGYSRKTRPDWALNTAIGVGIATPIIAGVYLVKSPLGRRYETETDEESQRQAAQAPLPAEIELRRYSRRVVVTSPEWIGGLFDCWDDVTVACLSCFCTFCVFGWNVERLGFGNMYVHIFTFILFCIAPLLVFSATALSIDDSDTIRYIMGISGILLCFFGLLYGGYWRIQMRKKFKLPGNPLCCGYPSATDCVQWFFCCSCSLAQEVRTGNFYDIEDDSFYRSVAKEDDGRPVMLPPIGEGGIEMSINPSTESPTRSHSCPPKIGATNGVGKDFGPDEMLPLSFERASTHGHVHTMQPPLPNLINMQDNNQ